MSVKREESNVDFAQSKEDGSLGPNSPQTAYSAEAEKRLVRKLDFVLLPLVFFTLALQYVDKVTINGAAQFGIIEDLNLFKLEGVDDDFQPIISLHRFSNATLIFYWGYLAATVPASILCQKLPIGKFVAATVMLWGAITMLTVTVKDYEPFLVLRFFLGVSEAAVGPAISIMVAMFWKRQEQPLRFSIWYTATGLGGFLGSMALYGMGHIQGSLPQWYYGFLILGAITVAWGIFLLWALPDAPQNARFLSGEEKLIALERMRSESLGVQERKFKWSQASETLLDPKTWLILVMSFCLHFVNGAISGFGSIIIRAFGYSAFRSVLLTGAVGAVVFVVLVVVGFLGSRVKNSRLLLYSFCEVPVIIGATLVWKMPWDSDRGAALAGFIVLGFFAASYTMLLSLVGANTAGHTKKVSMQAILWSTYAICNGVSPLFVKQSEVDEQYTSMFLGVIVTGTISCVSGLLLRFYYQYLNRLRDRRYGVVVRDSVVQELQSMDLTDMENVNFRYVL